MKTILIPTDFSAHSLRAMKFAVRMLATQTNVKLIFFHATETQLHPRIPTNLYRDAMQFDLETNWQRLKDFSNRMLKHLDMEKPPFEIDWIVKHGEFLRNILETIEEQGVDLVVAGKSTSTGLTRFFYGSGSAELLEKSPCAVLMYPARSKKRQIHKISLASVTLELDSFFQDLIDFAKLFEAEVEVFHIHDPATDVGAFDTTGFIKRLKQKYQYDKLTLSFVKAGSDDTVENIDTYIEDCKPDMISVASYERPWYEKIFNTSITKTLAFEADVPLLVLKRTAEEQVN
jgi:nucleotide-binding universal stress UspA family protein